MRRRSNIGAGWGPKRAIGKKFGPPAGRDKAELDVLLPGFLGPTFRVCQHKHMSDAPVTLSELPKSEICGATGRPNMKHRRHFVAADGGGTGWVGARLYEGDNWCPRRGLLRGDADLGGTEPLWPSPPERFGTQQNRLRASQIRPGGTNIIQMNSQMALKLKPKGAQHMSEPAGSERLCEQGRFEAPQLPLL